TPISRVRRAPISFTSKAMNWPCSGEICMPARGWLRVASRRAICSGCSRSECVSRYSYSVSSRFRLRLDMVVLRPAVPGVHGSAGGAPGHPPAPVAVRQFCYYGRPFARPASSRLGGIFDYASKRERLEEVRRELESPTIWDNPPHAQELGRERARLDTIVSGIDHLSAGLADAKELLDMAIEAGDDDTAQSVIDDLAKLDAQVNKLEFQRMFSGKMDATNAFVDIQAGAGGTEAQDWAEMLLRMYLRWAESRGWKTELLEVSGGEVAGIKSATF